MRVDALRAMQLRYSSWSSSLVISVGRGEGGRGNYHSVLPSCLSHTCRKKTEQVRNTKISLRKQTLYSYNSQENDIVQITLSEFQSMMPLALHYTVLTHVEDSILKREELSERNL